MTTHLNIGGTYKNLSSCGVNIGGVWKTVTKISANIGGAWKDVYNSITYAMRIATSTTGTDYCRFVKTGLLTAANTTVLECTIKCETSGSGANINMALNNGTKYTDLATKPTYIVCNYSGTSPYTHSMDTTSEHVYKMKFNGTTNCEFYVDGVLVHTATYANLVSSASNVMQVGDCDNSANMGGSTLWKTIRYNLNYVGSPTSFVEWDPTTLPSAQGWTLQGSALATIVTV